MSAWIYRKPEATHVRGLCVLCTRNSQKRKPSGLFYSLCSQCNKRLYSPASLKNNKKVYIKPKYGKYKKASCERCNFKALDKCQLDVHHKDRNHHNNDPNNLETLCANCHRLEHRLGKSKPPDANLGVL